MWVAICRGNARPVAMRYSRGRISLARVPCAVHPVARWFPVHADHLLKVTIWGCVDALPPIHREGIPVPIDHHDRSCGRPDVRIALFGCLPGPWTDSHILSAKEPTVASPDAACVETALVSSLGDYADGFAGPFDLRCVV